MEFELFNWTGVEDFRSPAEVPDPGRVLLVVFRNEKNQVIFTTFTTTEYINFNNEPNYCGYELIAWKYQMRGKKRRRAKK